MVNWTYIWTNYDKTQPEVKDDLGFTMYPQSTQGQPVPPAVRRHRRRCQRVLEPQGRGDGGDRVHHLARNQGVNAEITGNMPASAEGYDYPALAEIYPPELLDLFQASLEVAAPRTVSPYWSDISGALLSTWHPPDAVSDQTPADSQQFIEDVLHGRRLL